MAEGSVHYGTRARTQEKAAGRRRKSSWERGQARAQPGRAPRQAMASDRAGGAEAVPGRGVSGGSVGQGLFVRWLAVVAVRQGGARKRGAAAALRQGRGAGEEKGSSGGLGEAEALGGSAPASKAGAPCSYAGLGDVGSEQRAGEEERTEHYNGGSGLHGPGELRPRQRPGHLYRVLQFVSTGASSTSSSSPFIGAVGRFVTVHRWPIFSGKGDFCRQPWLSCRRKSGANAEKRRGDIFFGRTHGSRARVWWLIFWVGVGDRGADEWACGASEGGGEGKKVDGLLLCCWARTKIVHRSFSLYFYL
jgi:hypothetical protein